MAQKIGHCSRSWDFKCWSWSVGEALNINREQGGGSGMMLLIGKWWLRSAVRKFRGNLEDAVHGWGGGVSAAIPREASRWYGCRSQWHRSEEKCRVVDGSGVCVCV